MNEIGYQNTLADRIDVKGIGVHSGKAVSISLLPADVGVGIVFQRTDVESNNQREIPAVVSSVGATALCTVLGDPSGVNVMTVEHLMAALVGLHVDNVIVEVDSSEIPVMDGSSEFFVEAIDGVGLRSLSRLRRYLRVLKEIRFDMGSSWGMFTPYNTTRFEVEIDFDEEIIGNQSFASDLTPEIFRRDISRARTFGFMKDVERYWASGLALGSSLDNSVVIGDDNRVINSEGLRYEDEFVRHKTLDAVGDLALAGAQILGCYRSYRGGHKVNIMALQTLLQDQKSYEWVDVPETRHHAIHVELRALSTIGSPAYAADKS
ncbi:UDP-3-O-acyl-N-acetylglucosamine deacetylase [Candidatus Endowatersipora endosymbiont of Watersipora subatra]|uniref:UDP-3-O-acyl-N-acetylglucosamine deacetylase n=1 Tax=Candidatus Endowatersipora endosymbiont of Watersipora subatra TaxID=3077946 RepID=UPI00312C84BD